MEMTFFEKELKKIALNSKYIKKEKYVGNVCVFELTENSTARIEFVTTGCADNYNAIRVTLINKKEGVIDKLGMYICDIIGKKCVRGEMMRPYIWKYHDVDWYSYHPTNDDYKLMAQKIDDYLSCFK